MNRRLSGLSLSLLAIALAGCSMLPESRKIEYKSAGKAPTLEIPPDLSQIARDDKYLVPDAAGKGSATFSAYSADRTPQAQAQNTAVLPQVDKVRVERSGNQRWLVVALPAEKLWDTVKDFWQETGFIINVERPEAGVMETDWAENRANIPLDPIRAALGRALDSLYSTGQLDRFRTRLEANASGGTDIFVSQRGMEEIYTSRDRSTTSWQPRANDPGLEDEFLRRMMIALGVPKERADSMLQQSKAAGAAVAAQAHAAVQYNTAAGTVALAEDFDRAWRRVGLSLDRSGFTVEDRDRTSGTYYVRYVPFVAEKKSSKSWLGNLFGRKAEVKPVRYRVQVQNQGAGTVVRVLTENGQPAGAEDSSRILKVLSDDLRQM